MAVKHFLLAFSLSTVLLYCSKASLLQETLAKAEFKKENDEEETKVEIINDDKNSESESDKETNEHKDSSKDEPETSIHLKTIYRPTECNDFAKSGKVAVLHYTGWVGDKKFDSTIDPLKRYVPFEFIIGTGAVIKGFEKGVKEMCKGEQRKITIPPQLGYGEKGAGLIPGNENVVSPRVIV
jgi:FKBP-type peptidyl-prolyl cis-trans isomerase